MGHFVGRKIVNAHHFDTVVAYEFQSAPYSFGLVQTPQKHIWIFQIEVRLYHTWILVWLFEPDLK